MQDKEGFYLGYPLVKLHSPQELDSNLYRLFHQTFDVLVMYIDLLDTEEIRVFGHVSTGDDEEDTLNANRKIRCAFTIPKLLEFYRDHIPFYLPNDSEEHEMYDIITTHIREWTNYAQRSGNLKAVPYDDLIDLSSLATALFSARDRERDGFDDVMITQDFGKVINKDLPDFGDVLKALQGYRDKSKQGTHEVEAEKVPHLEDIALLRQIFTRNKKFIPK